MARFDFGGTLADFVVTSRHLGGLDVLGLSAATLTFWSAQTGGTRYTDLQLNGSTVSSISVASDGQVPKFQGPDGVTEMWADGGSARIRVVTLQGAPGPAGRDGTNGANGLPGVNAVANDTAAAGYVTTTGSATQTALDARYAPVDVRTFGAKVDGTTDDTTAVQSALNSGNPVVTLGNKGTVRLAATLTVPAGVRLTSSGAKLKLVGTNGFVKTGGVGAGIVGVPFDFSADSGLVGGEYALGVAHAQADVRNNSFVGNGFRYGVFIQSGTANGSCDDLVLEGNSFRTTSFGILKQGANGTTMNRARIARNSLIGIRRGDAIELNLGADTGVTVEDNVVDDVTANGIGGVGIGIGIAGSATYGAAESTYSKNFRIARNRVSNCDFDMIHVEMGANFVIEDNLVWQTGTHVGTQLGIVTFGCVRGSVVDNYVRDAEQGIRDDVGVTGGFYVASTDKTYIARNRVRDCAINGIFSGVAGENLSAIVESNLVETCPTGIYHSGAADISIRHNTVKDCATSYRIDMAPAGKANIAATYSNILHVEGNRALANGLPAPHTVVLTNTTASLFTGGLNNFSIGATTTDDRDYHTPGNVILDRTTNAPKVCTSPGWLQGDALSYTFTAVAGDNFVTVTAPGNPANGFKVGQRVTLPGAGASGAALTSTIRRIYSSGGFRLMLGDAVATTVSTPTAFTVATVAAYTVLATASVPDVQTFTAAGTWTKPSGKVSTTLILLSGGGGGGGGRRDAAGTVRCGGGGGGGGGRVQVTVPTAQLPATAAVVVGTGGAGAPATTTDTTNGANGSNGSASSFNLSASGGIRCPPGLGGSGGTSSTGNGGAGGTGYSTGSVGASANTSGGVGNVTVASQASAGGGSGGGVTSANVAGSGGQGGPASTVDSASASGGVVDGAAPGAGGARTAGTGYPGSGGGGGAGSITTAAQTGGAGGIYGGGGGGGGASVNGNNAGGGGAGADGLVLVISV